MPDLSLLELAERVVAEARPGEQVEAYLGRSSRTEVKVFGGEVESLSSADTAGIGVRVVVDGRQGFAYAGSLDPDVVAEVLAEARDNAGVRHGRRVPRPGRARRRGAGRPRPVPGGAGRLPHRPQGGAGPRGRPGHPGRRPPHPGAGERRLRRLVVGVGHRVHRGHPGHRPAHQLLGVGRGPGRRGDGDPDRLRLLGGPHAPRTSTWRRRRPTPPTGPPGCWAPASRRPGG